MFSRPIWDVGFRPFFLLAALYAAVIVPVWVGIVRGLVGPDPHLRAFDWHMHEMLYGVIVAVLAGFLLTAVRNWTKQQTASGGALAGLVMLWTLGRAAVASSRLIPGELVFAFDMLFLPALAFVVGRPIVRANSRRNLVFVPLLLALAACNAAMHAKALGWVGAWSDRAPFVAIDVLIIILSLIGGRIVPAFTGNAMKELTIERSVFADRWVFVPLGFLAVTDAIDWRLGVGVCALLAGLLSAVRMRGWGSLATRHDPMLWILHLGYAWIALGLTLRAASALALDGLRSGAMHALSTGALGILIIGMMTRVALGHTGRKITANGWTVAIYALVITTALLRTIGAIWRGAWYATSLWVAAALWTLAFVIYLVAYLPVLTGVRPDGKRDWRVAPG